MKLIIFIAFILTIYAEFAYSTSEIGCDNILEGETYTIDTNTKISDSCFIKDVSFVIKTSNVELDCNNSSMSSSKELTAIKILSDEGIEGITVKNCQIDGYRHALRISLSTKAVDRYMEGDVDPIALRERAPSNIVIENIKSNNSSKVAIYIDDHVNNVRLNNLEVSNSGTPGIYLEFGTQYITIENSYIYNSGREAIAIDSSAYNTIRNNKFSSNKAGAIFLYRNCWEGANHFPKKSNYFPRTQASKLNNIIGNEINGETVGIWVASRQSKDLASLHCTSYLMAKEGNKKYHLDLADRNRILGNNFINTKNGIIVEDDNVRIFGNSFATSVDIPITIGTKWRNKAKNLPVITFNTFFKRGAPISSMVKYVEGSNKRVECSNIGKDTYGNRYFLNYQCTQVYKDIVTEDEMYIIESPYSLKFLKQYYD